jgi:CRISPR-associated endonuclease/helicase Cas3
LPVINKTDQIAIDPITEGQAQDCIFWGKLKYDHSGCLSLTAHCLDVAICFRALCDLVGLRRSFEKSAGRSLNDQDLDRLSVIALFHDVGKANLGFQTKVFQSDAPKAGHVRELEPIFDDHVLLAGFKAALEIEDLQSWVESTSTLESLLVASWSHHGRPLMFKGERSGTYWLARKKWWHPYGEWEPMAAVADLASSARQAFPGAFINGVEPLPANPSFHHRFAGLVMLSDWLGSHTDWFPINKEEISERIVTDRARASKMIRSVGLDVSPLLSTMNTEAGTFQEHFGFAPRPAQAVIDTINPNRQGTELLIIEAETGSGKTEAALYWFLKLFVGRQVDGIYFALPTRVAAREIYRRVCTAIERWFPDPDNRPVTVLAVPGYPQTDGVAPEQFLPDERTGNLWQDDELLSRRGRQWAAERPKRFLAATIAVGTIDQALLSTIQTPHAHLRSICLDKSLLVVDEVHASDKYMSRLLISLLQHHRSIGGRAMLLSATLGATARDQFLGLANERSESNSMTDAIAKSYPVITFSNGTVLEPDTGEGGHKMVAFDQYPFIFSPGELSGQLIEALNSGARVLVILNTVNRVNSFLRLLESREDFKAEWLFRCESVICPHHGRFAPSDRMLLDAKVSDRLGLGSADGPLLLIGTQTLEQSLDIDADLMVSDLVPADVLLQRVGRLHRHNRSRPQDCLEPRCLILTPDKELENALDENGRVNSRYKQVGLGSVYEDLRTLALTQQSLATKPNVRIPKDNRWFVESATHPDALSSLPGEKWRRHGQDIEGGSLASAIAASSAAVVFDQYFGDFEFHDRGDQVASRLGANNLQLPLNRPIAGPFNTSVRQIVIPAHMAPPVRDDEVIVGDEQDGSTMLYYGGKNYQYSRYGLEALQ